MIAESFDVHHIPDAFIFMPEDFGGLGVRNPFRHLFVARNKVIEDPQEHVRQFLREEEEEWKEAKDRFESLSESYKICRWEILLRGKDHSQNPQPDSSMETDVRNFMSLSEFKLLRNSNSAFYKSLYNELTDVPSKSGAKPPNDIEKVPGKALSSSSSSLEAEVDEDIVATVSLYADELFEKFGGLSIVERDMLPLGVIQLLRSKRVGWQSCLKL